MKRLLCSFYFLLLVAIQSFPQTSPGARQISLAHSDVALSNDAFALFNNPAGLSYVTSLEVGFFYSPSPFEIRELSNGFGAYSQPTSIGTFSSGFMIYGFDLYKETSIALGYGNKVSDNFSFGFTTIYKNISIKNYGNKGFFTFNLGGIAELSQSLNLGFTIENITRTTIGNEQGQLPVVFWAGLSYKVIKELQIFAAINKEINYDASPRIGAEYKLLEFLHLRFGISNEPDLYAGGIGIVYSYFQFDYAVTSHPDLGLTHQFGLIIRL